MKTGVVFFPEVEIKYKHLVAMHINNVNTLLKTRPIRLALSREILPQDHNQYQTSFPSTPPKKMTLCFLEKAPPISLRIFPSIFWIFE